MWLQNVEKKMGKVRARALLPQLCPYVSNRLCVSLTVSLPAVSPDREGRDSISGDPGGGGCDLHLDTPCTLLVVAFQCCAVQ